MVQPTLYPSCQVPQVSARGTVGGFAWQSPSMHHAFVPCPNRMRRARYIVNPHAGNASMDSSLHASSAVVPPHAADYRIDARDCITGDGAFREYMGKLNALGFPVDRVRVFKCHTPFTCRNYATAECWFAAVVPVFLGPKFVEALAYVFPGSHPFLLSHPVVEASGLILGSQQGLGKAPPDDAWCEPHQCAAFGDVRIDLLKHFRTPWCYVHPEQIVLPECMLDHVDVKHYIDARAYCQTDYNLLKSDPSLAHFHSMSGTAIRELGPIAAFTFERFRNTAPTASTDRWVLVRRWPKTILRRTHYVPRRDLFHPCMCDCPVPVDSLSSIRLTTAICEDGIEWQIHDNWKDPMESPCTDAPNHGAWTGSSDFTIDTIEAYADRSCECNESAIA